RSSPRVSLLSLAPKIDGASPRWTAEGGCPYVRLADWRQHHRSLLVNGGGLRPFFISADQSKFLQLVAQSVAADVEQLGGMGLVAVRLAHGQLHHGMLNLFQRCAAFRNI